MKYLDYLVEGFKLANKAWVVYLISLVTLGVLYLPSTGLLVEIEIILFVTYFFLMISFFLSEPYFLLLRHQNKALDPKLLLMVTLKNTKRSILPLILLIIIFLLALGLILLVVYLVSGQDPEQFFSSSPYPRHPLYLLYYILFSLFAFSTILFSVEDQNLLRSVWKGLILGFNHLKFVLLIGILAYLSAYLLSFLPEGTWFDLADGVINYYLAIILSAASLLYYLKEIKKA